MQMLKRITSVCLPGNWAKLQSMLCSMNTFSWLILYALSRNVLHLQSAYVHSSRQGAEFVSNQSCFACWVSVSSWIEVKIDSC